MAKKGTKKRNHKRKFTLPVAVVAGFMPGVTRVVGHTLAGGVQQGTHEAGRIYLGYDSQTGAWNPGLMWFGFAPIVLGIVVHKIASGLGINRALGRAGIPLVRI